MGWRTIHVKESERMSLKLDNLEIVKRGMKYYIPLSDINMMVIEGNTSLTTNILTAFTKNDIVVILCDNKYMPTGMLLNYGEYHHFAKRALAQAGWTKKLKAELWRAIVGQKILNQIQFNIQKGIAQDRIDKMVDLYSGLTQGDQTNREGLIAKMYFAALYGKDFIRGDEGLENLAMNYGYAIIRAAIARIVVGQGLLPVYGVFHHNEYNAFNLVDDLMEPFRPLMDYWIDEKISKDYEYLAYEARLTLIDFLNQPMWYKNQKSSVELVMEKYIASFIKATEKKDVSLLYEIRLADFVEARK